ncbi:hypothetical protein [Mangrovicoccus sp. HB161399]|uniref:hypothetical protein n=1 Tax=Mangrovicoccus sp. HB161399 TaxID=2720392 RepID=UPI0015576E18|nr:hypothetical protein [Mangrovicoccus sp. HB161399]
MTVDIIRDGSAFLVRNFDGEYESLGSVRFSLAEQAQDFAETLRDWIRAEAEHREKHRLAA